jgi:MATE family multidrug resistance protein
MMNERQIILKHAATVLVGQLAVVAFGVTDTLIAGQYDPQALAVLSVSAAIYITVYVALLGVLQALLPFFAELYGAKNLVDIGKTFHQGIYIWLLLCILGVFVLISPQLFLNWTDVPVDLQKQSISYLSLLAFALPPALFFRLYSSLNQSLGKPQLVTWIQAGALLIKIPLSVLLTFGSGDIPAQGLLGCAMGTVMVNYTMMAVALWSLKTNALYATLRIWRHLDLPNWPKIRQMAVVGLPNGLSVTVEVTSFTLMALFIARLGTTAAASHQIASNMAALCYMVPLSFSIAISARISFWRGAADFVAMRLAMMIGFQFVMGLSIAISTVLWIFHSEIAHLYAKDEMVAQMASELLLLIGAYHLVDAMQTLCFFVLRSFKITIAPMVVYSIMLWGVGLPGGYFLAYQGLWGASALLAPNAFWMMSILALIFVCGALIYLIHMSLKQQAQDAQYQ